MEKVTSRDWLIEQSAYDINKKLFYESIFSLGNGYMGVRGFHGEDCKRNSHEQCTYIAGIFDYIEPGITDMVNTPNFLYTRLNINGSEFNFRKGKINNYKRVLNMKDGTLTCVLEWEDNQERKTRIESKRFLSIHNVHNAVIRYEITPLNYSGNITVETGIDAGIANNPINDDQLKENFKTVRLLNELEKGVEDDGTCYITMVTGNTVYRISEAFCVQIRKNGKKLNVQQDIITDNCYIAKKITFPVESGNSYTLDKIVSVYTTRDDDAKRTKSNSIDCVREAAKIEFESLLKNNSHAWEKKWDIADVIIEGEEKTQLSIRYNIFQLIQTNAEDNPNVSIGARGIMHGRYKGCYFWDTEIFMFPFYMYTNPNAARSLLMFRYNTLPGAEKNAQMQTVDGARYAWMCSFEGIEQCNTWDIGLSEAHITADIAYAIDQYYIATGDEEFIRDYGAEIYIKTARYWKSRFTYSSKEDCYNMLFVKGPNEYGGVSINNAFTTLMALHNLKLAMNAISMLKRKYPSKWSELKEKINFKASELKAWQAIIKKAKINYDYDRKLYIEDDNFFKAEPLDIAKYKKDDTPFYRKISFDRLQRYRVLKQADVILLMILLPEDFTDEEKRAAWDFYEPITLHDSTLSFGTHALFAARLGINRNAYDYFNNSLRLDLDDIMCNTSEEGLHTGAFGSTWQALINGFGGVQLHNDYIDINPNLPKAWKSMKFKVIYKGNLINMTVSKKSVSVDIEHKCKAGQIDIRVNGKPYKGN